MQWRPSFFLQRLPIRKLLFAGLIAAGFAVAIGWLYESRIQQLVPTHAYAFQDDQLEGWSALGGNWRAADGVVRNISGERGAKLLSGSKDWRNYTISADVRLDREYGDMGVILRSNYERAGLDSYEGYYVGLRPADGSIVIGRSNYGWSEARPVPLPGGVHASVWYRLRVTTFGCKIAASAINLSTQQVGWIAFEDRSCVESGRIGLRSVDTSGMWQNVSVASAGLDDYLALRHHAAAVEYPPASDGPPWWTPWHAGLLFGGSLCTALLMQLIYFRMQRWKAQALAQERGRLAHEIHDTMAQSFAGVGYQIQGIRKGILRGERQDIDLIAEQLNVAYQLVRKCHEEASKTVAVLGSSTPMEQNLLRILEETTHKIAGSRIKTVTHLRGSATPLSLRLMNALVQVGQEAIANAVSHADPTILALTLIYEGNSLELTIEDNGSGFLLTPELSGFGILGMQKRAREVAGTLNIASIPNHGTQVRLKVNLQRRKLPVRLWGARGTAASERWRVYPSRG